MKNLYRGLFTFIFLFFISLAAFAQWPSNYLTSLSVGQSSYNDVLESTLPDGHGGVYVAWRKGSPPEGHYYDTYLSHVDKDGTVLWSQVVCALADHTESLVTLMADGADGVIVTWLDSRNFANCTGCESDVYGQRVTANGTMLWPANGKLLASSGSYGTVRVGFKMLNGGNDDFYLLRSVNGSCHAVLGCQEVTDKIVAHRFDMDGNALWSSEQEIFKTTNVDQNFQADFSYDSATNKIFAVWQDSRANTCASPGYGYNCITNFDLYAQSIDGNTGAKMWADTGVPVNTTVDFSSFGDDKMPAPRILADAGSGVVITWTDFRDNTAAYLYGMRLSKSNGSMVWTAAGKKLSTAAVNVAYGASYSVVYGSNKATWYLAFAASTKTIYVQKFMANGTLLFGSAGKVLSDDAQNNVNPVLVENQDEPVITWTKHFGYASEIMYAQKLNADGTIRWATPRRINSGTGGWMHRSVTDAQGGAIIAWTDYEFGNDDMKVRLTSLTATGKFKGGLTLIGGYANGATGTYVDVPVMVEDFDNILTGQFTITWDPAVAQFESTNDYGMGSVAASSFGIANASSGKLTFSWDDPESNGQTLPSEAVLFTIRFKLVGTPGSLTDLTFDSSVTPIEFYDNDFEPVKAKTIAGQIYVDAYDFIFHVYAREGNTVGGTKTGLANVELYLDGNFMNITDWGGSASIGLVPPDPNSVQVVTPSYYEGTTDGIDAADLILARKHILGTAPLQSPYQIIAVDADQSGTTSTIDIAMIRALILGKIPDFQGTLWKFVNDYTHFQPADKYNMTTTPFWYLDTMPVDFESQNLDELLEPEALGFVAVRIGDVDASWASVLPVGRTTFQESVAFQAAYYPDATTGMIEIPVQAADFNQVSAFQFTITWDANAMEFAGLESDALPIVFNDDHAAQGVLPVLWDHADGTSTSLTHGTTVMRLKFRKRGEQTAIQIGSSLTKAIAYTETLQPMSVTLLPADGDVENPYGVQVYPVPMNNELNAVFTLKESSSVRMVLTTLTGAEVLSVQSTFAKGFNHAVLNTAGVQAGMYLMKVTIGREQRIIKVVKQ